MKHIVILDTGREWGGGTNSLLELVRRLDRQLFRCTAIFYHNYPLGDKSDIKTELERCGVAFEHLPQWKLTAGVKLTKELARAAAFFSSGLRKRLLFFFDRRFRIMPAAGRIADIVGRLRPDLIYLNNQPSSNLEGILAAGMTGVPAVQHCRKVVSLNRDEVATANRTLSRIICVSPGVRDDYTAQGIDAHKCCVVCNGIDVDATPGKTVSEVRTQWGIGMQDLLIGYAGSLIPLKRVEDFISAAGIVAKMCKVPVAFMVVGTGPEEGRLKILAGQKNIEHLFHFVGFQNDALSCINAMDIFVLTSEREGMPRVIMEAMLMGKPVVASDVTGPKDLVVPAKTGMLVPCAAPERFADALLRLADDGDLRVRMGTAGKDRILRNFSIDRYVSGIEKVFSEVLSCS